MDSTQISHKQHLKKIDQRWITVEPTNGLYTATGFAIQLILAVFLYEEGQKKFGVTLEDTGCGDVDEIKNITENERLYKQSISFVNSMIFLTESLPMLLYGTILGTYGDKAGRKAILIPALVMTFIGGVCYIFLISFKCDYQFLPLIAFISYCGGGPCAVNSSCAAYISDISKNKRRMYRMVILETFTLLAKVLVEVGIGYILTKSITIPLYITTGIFFLIVLYTAFLLPESVQKDPARKFFDKSVFLKFPKLFIGRPGQKNTNLIRLAFIIQFFYAFLVMASQSIYVFYLKDSPFCWSSKDIGWYQGIRGISSAVAIVIMGKIISKFKIKNTSVIIFCFYFVMVHFILNGVADNSILIYVALVPSILASICFPTLMNFASKVVDPKDVGTMMGGMLWCLALGMTTGPFMWNTIYAMTSLNESTRPYVFYIGAGINIVCVLAAMYLHYKSKDVLEEIERRKSTITEFPSINVEEI